jgi:neutral amino acid transport system permease protein
VSPVTPPSVRRRRLLAVLLVLLTAAGLLLAPGASPAGAQDGPDDVEEPDAVTDDTDDPDGADDPDDADDAPGGAQSVGGRLRDADGEPVPGVEMVVTLDGDEIGSDTSDDEGAWRVTVPTAGRYTIELDEGSLPEDLGLRNPDRNPFDTDVRAGQAKTVLFPLGDRGAAGRGALERGIDLAAQGLKLGAIIALAAVGLSLIFGITGLVNFAHGELVTLGAVVAFFFNAAAPGPGWHLVPATVLAVLAGAGVGYVLERGFFRPLRARRTGLIALIVVTIGLSLMLRHLFLIFMGGRPRPYMDYAVQRAVSIGPVNMAPKDMAIIVIALVALAAVGLMLQKTRIGTAMRAVADNRDLAAASGIDVNKVILAVWVIGGGLAALGGVLFGVTESVAWDMGFRLLLIMFAAIILGGLGTAYGAMAGGILIGLTSEVSTVWLAVDFKLVVVFAVLILTLLFRPQGIFGVRERIG